MTIRLIRRAGLLAVPVVVAIALAGCGGSASTGVGGTTASAGVRATTTNGGGGVLGAHATLGKFKLQAQAGNALQLANHLVTQLSSANSAHGLAQLTASARRQVLQIANGLQRLNLTNADAKQARDHLVSTLHRLASELATAHTDAAHGNLVQALGAVHMSSLSAVQNAVGRTAGLGTAALRSVASSVAAQLEQRVLGIHALNTKQGLTSSISRLQAYLRRARKDLSGLNVPSSQQRTKQKLLTFVQHWQTDLQSAKQHARQGQVAQAKKQALGLSLEDIQNLVTGLLGGSGGAVTTTGG